MIDIYETFNLIEICTKKTGISIITIWIIVKRSFSKLFWILNLTRSGEISL